MYHIKKDKRSIQSGQWIYKALSELLQERSLGEISITEVVEKAQLGRATFYRNFDSLEDVLRMKCDEVFLELYHYLIDYYSSYREEAVKAIFLKPFLRFWYLQSSIVELLIKANRIDIINDSFEKMLGLFMPHIDSAHEIIWQHPEYFLSLRSGIAINILIKWIKDKKKISPDELADLIVKQMKESINLNLLL